MDSAGGAIAGAAGTVIPCVEPRCARAMTPEPGLVVGGKYRLTRALASGGMGSVWVAEHTQLDVEIAAKFMAAELSSLPSAGTRFEREAKAAAQLKSPHVVHIHDYGMEDGTRYI